MLESERIFDSVVRNVMQILLPKNDRNHRAGSIGFQAMLGSIVTFALVCDVVACFVSGSLLLGTGVFAGVTLLATACELGYLCLNVHHHHSALANKIRDRESDSIDRGTYFFLNCCFQLENFATYPKLVKTAIQTAIEAPISEYKDLKQAVQSEESKRSKIGHTALFLLAAPLGFCGTCPVSFFKKAKEKVQERYSSVVTRAGYTPVR
ncbi:MAG: hypothetical protein ABIH77_06195 [Pseudomonadota bacterium]